MTKRRRTMTGKARLAFLKEHGSTCHICGGAIQPGDKWEIEHVIALSMGGDDEPGNTRPAHAKCHRAKTDADLAAVAKAKRREIARHGAKQPPKVKMRSKSFPKADRPERNKIGVPPRRGFYRSVEQ